MSTPAPYDPHSPEARFGRYPYDHWDLRSFLLGPLYPAAYWTISAAAALRCQAIALIRGPREQRVVWDIEREAVEPEAVAPPR